MSYDHDDDDDADDDDGMVINRSMYCWCSKVP